MKSARFTIGVAAAIAAATFATGVMAQQPVVMRIAHAMPTTHGYHNWAERFREELKKTAGNRIDVRIFPNAQLGKETEYIEGMKLGTIDGAIFGRHGQIDPRLDVLNLPMIYRDDAHVERYCRNSPVQMQIDQIMYERGFKVLGWGELGFRHVTTGHAGQQGERHEGPRHSRSERRALAGRLPRVGREPDAHRLRRALLGAAAGRHQGAGESPRNHQDIQLYEVQKVHEPYGTREHPVADRARSRVLGASCPRISRTS